MSADGARVNEGEAPEASGRDAASDTRAQRAGSSTRVKSGLAALFSPSRRVTTSSSLRSSGHAEAFPELLPPLSEERATDEEREADDGDGDCGGGPESPTPPRGQGEDERSDGADGGPAFQAMVRSLRTDASLLALAVDDVTPRRLLRVREALGHRERRQQDDEDDERPHAEPSAPPGTPQQLVRVRTMVAVDTLRLLLERARPLDVQQAVDAAVRSVLCATAAASGIAPLAKAPAVLTACNIARVVLLTRQELAGREGDGPRPVGPLQVGPRPVGPSVKPRLVLAKSLMLHTPSPSAKGPPPSPTGRSGRAAGASSPATTRRATSILAMEGEHVLLQEKLARFEHRGPSPVAGSVPRVRRAGDESSEAAAQRRKRAIEYAARQQKLNLTY